MLRPLSPGAKRRVQWARTRAPHAPVRELAADGKFACQRALSRHAALVVRYDGALLRVAGIHRFPKEAVCSVDLVRGYDDLLLAELPADERTDMGASHTHLRQAIAGGGVLHISAAALSPPEHVLVVPGFFGGVLRLVNKLDVRVIGLASTSRASRSPASSSRRLTCRRWCSRGSSSRSSTARARPLAGPRGRPSSKCSRCCQPRR